MKKILILLSFFLFIFVLADCDKNNPTEPDENEPVETTKIVGQVTLPGNSPLIGKTLSVLSPLAQKQMETGGGFEVSTAKADKHQLLMAMSSSGNPVLLSYPDPDSQASVSLSATSTAIALVMINPFFMKTTADQRREIINKVNQHQDFPILVTHIQNLLVNDPDNTLDYLKHPRIYEEAVRIGIDILKEFGSNPQVLNKPEAPANFLDIMSGNPYVENAGADSIAFLNPNCIYYGAGIFESDNSTRKATVLLDAKSSLWSYRLGWPPVFWTPATRSPYKLGNGSFELKLTKGYDFSSGIGELFNWNTPNGRASLCNTGKGVLIIVDLVVSYSFTPSFQSLHLTIPANTLLGLEQAIQNKDSWGVANVIINIVIANVDNVCYWLWQEATNDAAKNFMKAAHGILKNVAAVVKIIFMAESGINRAAPFFYDLVTAEPSLNYFVTQQNGSLTLNKLNSPPNKPSAPYGPSTGNVNNSYDFSTSTTDPEYDNISYRFHWGDGEISDWSSEKYSGSSYSASHSFSAAGTYNVTAEAKDIYGSVSLPANNHQIVIYPAGSFLFEDFNHDMVGGFPSDPPWTIRWEDPSYVRISNEVYYGSSGNSCGFFDFDPAIEDTAGVYATIHADIEDRPTGTVEFMWRVDNQTDHFGLRVWQDWDWNTMGYYVLFQDGYLCYYDGSSFNNIMAINSGTWYHLKLSYSRYTKTYDIYVNGSLKLRDVPFVGDPQSLNIFQVVAFSDAICRAGYIDDIKLSTTLKSGLRKRTAKLPAHALRIAKP